METHWTQSSLPHHLQTDSYNHKVQSEGYPQTKTHQHIKVMAEGIPVTGPGANTTI